MTSKCLSLLLSLTCVHAARHIDNGVQGSPEIGCIGTSMSVTLNTEWEFAGRFFVTGREHVAACRNDARPNDFRAVATLELSINEGNECGVTTVESSDPKGLYTYANVTIHFDKTLPTDADNTYQVHCFYETATGMHMTHQAIDTSWYPVDLPPNTGSYTVELPKCNYEIVEETTSSLDDEYHEESDSDETEERAVTYAELGDRLRHVWKCVSDMEDMFCLFVHSCNVTDQYGKHHLKLIDSDGCALNTTLMPNLNYSSDLVVEQTVPVFEYRDRPALKFQCSYEVGLKRDRATCKTPVCG